MGDAHEMSELERNGEIKLSFIGGMDGQLGTSPKDWLPMVTSIHFSVPCYQVSIMPKKSYSRSQVKLYVQLFFAELWTLLTIQPPEAIRIVMDPLSYQFLPLNAGHLLLHYFLSYSTPVGFHSICLYKFTWAFIFLPSQMSMQSFYSCFYLEQE